MKSILKQLTNYYGPPGHEMLLTDSISELFKEYCDEVTVDKFNNIIAVKRAIPGKDAKYKVMIAAHVDEISLMVTDIDNRGFIKFTAIGGIDTRILPSQEVIIHGKKDILGIIGVKPPHILDKSEKEKALKIEDMYIDIGKTDIETKNIICVGDTINFKPAWTELQNQMISSKSLDNRAGVAVMISVLKELRFIKHDVDIYCVSTVQEEVGLRGATVSAFSINPDAAIVVDGCHAKMPGLDTDETFTLGKGPAIAIGPNINKILSKRILSIAKEENIPFQIDVEPGYTGTDAWVIQVSRSGIPAALISFPLRYMHSTVEMISLADLKNTAKIISALTKQLSPHLEVIKNVN